MALVLIVDDSPTDVHVMQKALEQGGFRTASAADGSEAIRKARIGIAITGDSGAGPCLLAHNMISDARDGAIRVMDHAKPVGADLIAGKAPRHLTLVGNIAV